MDPVTGEALAELIAGAVTSVAGRAWKQVRGTPEGRAVKVAIRAAVGDALRVSALPPGTAVGDVWVAEMDKAWRPAFTPEVLHQLVVCLADPSGDAAHVLARLARQRMAGSGSDLDELGRTLWVEEFLTVLPRQVFKELSEASVRNPAVRSLVDHVLRQRAEARASAVAPATPGELRRDLITLLRGLDQQARTGRLPAYLPAGADVTELARTVRVRPQLRASAAGHPGKGDAGGSAADRVYRLPVERPLGDGALRPWPEIAEEHRRLVVLGDPGLGKSWLVRTETHRLCIRALACLAEGPGPAVIPIPLRCDGLALAAGQDLAEKAAAHLVAQGLLAERSRAEVAAQVRTGDAVVLLDALDELTGAESGLLRELVRLWADQAADRARCVITSRIAGYTGSPLPGAREVELQAFTPDDAAEAIEAWQLPAAAAPRLRDRLRDPATGAMARIPLLLALICSLAAQTPDGEALPATRGQLYERVMRWFLTRSHRSPDDPREPALDDVQVEARLEILAPVACTFATQTVGWTDLMPADGLLKAIRTAGPAFTELHRPAAEILRELSVGAGVLVPDGDPSGGRSPHYLFLHRTVAEYLTARHLAGLPERDWLTVVERHRWFDPDWTEVVPMLGERLRPHGAQALIHDLLSGDYDPFNWSLLIAARVWGARQDAEHLLPHRQADELAERLDRLFGRDFTRRAVTAADEAMAYLSRPVLIRLLARLTDQDEIVRCAAVAVLTRREGPGVTEALLARLADQDPGVWYLVVRALAGREGPGVTEALLDRLTDQDAHVQRGAVRALARREGLEVTEALLACLADQDPGVWHAAVRALAGREGLEVTEALLACLADQDSGARSEAVRALAEREGPEVTETLLACLTDPSWYVWSAALGALAGREGPEVTEALLACLTDPDSGVRGGEVKAVEALEALAGREGREVTEALLACLTDPSWRVRKTAVEAVARREGPGVTEALIGCFADRYLHVGAAAAEAVARREGPGVTEALLDRLTDQRAHVRRGAECRQVIWPHLSS